MTSEVRGIARPLRATADLGPLLDRVGDALDAFARWPTWMWADDEVVDFCRWLRGHNVERHGRRRDGRRRPVAARAARRRRVVLVGMGGYRGGVIAAQEWGAQMERMPVAEARPGSREALLHAELGQAALVVVPAGDRPDRLTTRLDHRAIGVVYRPEREGFGNYVPTVLGERYDAFLWFDDTTR